MTIKYTQNELVETSAWFFLLVKLINVPFYLSLGLINKLSLSFNGSGYSFCAIINIRILPIIPQQMLPDLF